MESTFNRIEFNYILHHLYQDKSHNVYNVFIWFQYLRYLGTLFEIKHRMCGNHLGIASCGSTGVCSLEIMCVLRFTTTNPSIEIIVVKLTLLCLYLILHILTLDFVYSWWTQKYIQVFRRFFQLINFTTWENEAELRD